MSLKFKYLMYFLANRFIKFKSADLWPIHYWFRVDPRSIPSSISIFKTMEWRHLVSYQEYSVWDWGPFWCDCRIGSYMIRYKCWIPFLEWRHLVSYQEYSAWCWDSIHSENGATWSATRNPHFWTESPSDVVVHTWSDLSVEPFWCDVFTHGWM